MSKAEQCPICKNPAHDAFRPFCGKRCSDVDLGRWLKGGYAIAGVDGEAAIPANDHSPNSNPDRDTGLDD